jgi:hypothetical protein
MKKITLKEINKPENLVHQLTGQFLARLNTFYLTNSVRSPRLKVIKFIYFERANFPTVLRTRSYWFQHFRLGYGSEMSFSNLSSAPDKGLKKVIQTIFV